MFSIYAVIQDGHQKWRENIFWGVKATSRLSRYPVGHKFCRHRSISHHFRDKCTQVFYAETQDGRQK